MTGSQTIDRRHFLTALAAAALTVPSLTSRTGRAANLPAHRWMAVQRLIDSYISDKKIVGAVAALSYGGKTIVYPAAGTIAIDSPVRFDEHSLCRIYSMTKPVTGVAAMTLVEDGRIALDQPVADVLPEWRSLRVAIDIKKDMESRPALNPITMRHLLTHTSGLSYWTPLADAGVLPAAYRERGITPGNYGSRLNRPGYGPQAGSLAEMVQRIATLPLAFEPGTAWLYSIGLDVMGLVIERVSGKGLDVFFRERIFDPLDMVSTGFQVAPKNVARMTTNYNVAADGLKVTDAGPTSVWLKPPTLPAGGAGLISTARDYARFGAMLLGDGALGRVRVMKPETARRVQSNLLPAGVVYPLGGGFGAGARLVLPGSDQRFGPAGSFGWGGAAGTLWAIDPLRRGNMVLMTQHMPPDTYPIRQEMAAAIDSDLKNGKTKSGD
jgi:CubicO group peptidase (beta-lactamase class C family)